MLALRTATHTRGRANVDITGLLKGLSIRDTSFLREPVQEHTPYPFSKEIIRRKKAAAAV